MDYVFNLSQKTGVGLFDLLDDWKSQQGKLSIQIPEDVNAVNVMTIHKSKGLDWPVVIMAQGNWSKKHNKHSVWVDVPDETPLPVMILPTSKQMENSIFKGEYEKEMGRIEIDNFNALYVAFTRAAERLYVMTIKPESDFFGDVFEPLLEMEGNELVETSYADVDGKSKLKTLSFGTVSPKVKKSSSANQNTQMVALNNRKNGLYRKKLKVKKNYLQWMSDTGERDYGNLVHKAFSLIDSRQDVDVAVLKLISNGELDEKDGNALKMLLENVINHADLSAYFEDGLLIKNESDIVLPNGDLLRPDRVVIDGSQACVIDFKTGMRKPEHDQQVLTYKLHLEGMGYVNVKAMLVYTQQVEVVVL
jgi:ATP-dependent exoDNAse (exonuclease V) beta subunit